MYKNSLIDLNKFVFGSIFLCSLSLNVLGQKNWELAKSKDRIEVYTKDAPGWPLKAYLARGIINCSYEKALAYLYELEKRKDWVQDCTTSDVLHKVGSSEFIVYFVIDAPWPTSDRDMVLKMIADTETEENAVYFRFQGLPHYIPEKDGNVRVNKAVGYWKVRKAGDNMVEISTEGKSTTGGDIPDWLANMFVVDNPYDSIKNLKEILEAMEETPK